MPEILPEIYQRSPYRPVPGNNSTARDWNKTLQEWDRQNQEAEQQAVQLIKQQQQRFASYLMSRGVLMPMERTDAFFGVLTARRQGHTETKSCIGIMKSLTGKCLVTRESETRQLDWSKDFEDARKQDDKSWHEYQICLERTRDPSLHPPSATCQRMARCQKPDNLPF
jgi:hypothetical protein